MNRDDRYLAEAAARDMLISHIAQRLALLDEKSLSDLDHWTAATLSGEKTAPAQPPHADVVPAHVSRRRFLGTLAIGGAALVATNTATALIALDKGIESGSRDTQIDLMPQITRLQDLVELYRRLEALGLDDAVAGALGTLGPLVKAASAAGKMLLLGVGVIEFGLAQVEAAQAAIGDAADFVRGLVEDLEAKAADLWRLLTDATGVAVPLSDVVGSFFSSIVTKIPFGIGDRIQQALEWMGDLVSQLPDALASIKSRLLAPLKTELLDSESSTGLQQVLLTPIREQLIAPAKDLAAELERLQQGWETMAETPIGQLLAERESIRAQIAAQNGNSSRAIG